MANLCGQASEMHPRALLTRRLFTCCICAEIQSISGGLRHPYLPLFAILAKTLKLEFSDIFGKKSALFAANPAKATSFGHLSGGLLCMWPSRPPPHSVEGRPSPLRPESPFIGGGSRAPAIYSTLAALPAGHRSAFSSAGTL